MSNMNESWWHFSPALALALALALAFAFAPSLSLSLSLSEYLFLSQALTSERVTVRPPSIPSNSVCDTTHLHGL